MLYQSMCIGFILKFGFRLLLKFVTVCNNLLVVVREAVFSIPDIKMTTF